MIRLIALDMDGTLLDSNKNAPAEFNDWVIAHPEVQVVIASGRQYFTLEAQFEAIKNRLIFIGENGSVIVRNGEVLYKAPMTDDSVKATLDLCSANSAYSLIVCGLKSAYLGSDDAIVINEAAKYYASRTFVDSLYEAIGNDDVFKLAVYIHDLRAEEEYNKFPQVPEGLSAVLSGDSWIDIARDGIDKGSALKVLQDILKISPDECMVFGDYLNDYSMFEACKHSYAMRNAHPDLKKIAAHITRLTNDENGVMETLKEIFD